MMKSVRRFTAALALAAALTALAPPLASADSGAVDLNAASEEQLTAFPGIGPSKAKAIVEYRASHPFRSVDEMKNVKGIGDKLYEQLKDQITVGGPAAGSSDRGG